MSTYLPFGFQYPSGFAHNDANPDPGIEAIRKRVNFLNHCHDAAVLPDGTLLPGHIFTAALDLFQSTRDVDIDVFWDTIQSALTPVEVAEVAMALAPNVTDAKPYLDFPNAIALFDCRFVSTKEWEHIRRYSIGGSEVGTILGVSHFQSPRSLYFEKKKPPIGDHDIGTQQIFDYGHMLEDYIIDQVATTLGGVRYPESRMFAHKDYPFLTCNPDGILAFPDGTYCLFESKTATQWKKDDWKDGIPDYYVPQPRHYMGVLNDPKIKNGYIGCCMGALPTNLKVHAYERDLDAEQEQTKKVVAFWHNHIVPDVPPALCGDADLDLKAVYLYEDRSGATVQQEPLSTSAVPLFDRYFALKEQQKLLNKEIVKAEVAEKSTLAEIKPLLADDLMICSQPDSVSYMITVKDTERRFVNESLLPADVAHWLRNRIRAVKGVEVGFNIPKVSKKVAAKSAVRKKAII